MNINDASFELAQKVAFKHPHEPGQNDKINLSLPERFDIGPLCAIIKFGSEFAGRDKSCGNFSLPRSLQNGRICDIAQHHSNFGSNLSSSAGLGDRNEIGSLS